MSVWTFHAHEQNEFEWPVTVPTLISIPAGTTIGLKDSEWGRLGPALWQEHWDEPWRPPAAAAYAVLPVGVEMISPCKYQINLTTSTSGRICSPQVLLLPARDITWWLSVSVRILPTIALYRRNVTMLNEEVQVTNIRMWPSAYNNLIHNL